MDKISTILDIDKCLTAEITKEGINEKEIIKIINNQRQQF